LPPESEGRNNDIDAIELAKANFQSQQGKMQTQSAAHTESDGFVGMEQSRDVLVAGVDSAGGHGFGSSIRSLSFAQLRKTCFPGSKTMSLST
jgi:hypothetical protein